MPLPSGSDKTVVSTSKAPKVLVLDNADLGTRRAVTFDGALALRHAADLTYNTVYFQPLLWEKLELPPFEPANGDIFAFEKGDEYVGGTAVNPDFRVQIKVTRPDPTKVIAAPSIFEIKPLRRYELIFVGTHGGDSKLVRVTSALATAPAPGP